MKINKLYRGNTDIKMRTPMHIGRFLMQMKAEDLHAFVSLAYSSVLEFQPQASV